MNRRRLLFALVPCVLSVLVGVKYLQPSVDPDTGLPFWPDATTYLAAGERLNAGRDLYTLGPGDREVFINTRISPAALLSPPTIAVIWRPIAAVPFGYGLWVAAIWASLLGTVFFLVYRTGLLGAVVATAFAMAIGEQLAVANVAGFFPMLLTLSWLWRGSLISGAMIGLMASIKLSPGALGGWLLGTRAWRGLAGLAIALGAAALLSIIGAGPSSIPDYLKVAASIGPSDTSLSGLSGISWMSQAVLVGGTILAIILGPRWPAWAFVVAVIASVLGTPALYVSGLPTLLAVMAPLTDRVSEPKVLSTIGELPADTAPAH